MRLAPALFVVLSASALIGTACTIKEGDAGAGGSGNSGNEGGTTTTTDEGGGGTAGAGGGLSCEDQCAVDTPDASLTLWLDMVGCTYCGACYDTCDAGAGTVCEVGAELGCSAAEPDCLTCVNSDCAQITQCGAEVDACLADQACLDFNTCYGSCPG